MNRRITVIISKVLLWALGIILALLTVVQFLFSPKVLTPFIEKYATHYIDADVKFKQVSVNMFRNFPNISVNIDSCLITYSSDRFSEYITKPEIMKASLKGCCMDSSEFSADTLASMEAFRATVNPFALLHNRLRIKQISISDLKAYAHRYDSACVNWNILKNLDSGSDTVKSGRSGELPVPVIGRISLDDPEVIISDELSGATLMGTFSSFDFKGNRDSDKDLIRDFRLKADSLFVFGSIRGDSTAVRIEKIRLLSTGTSGVAGQIEVKLMSSSKSHGRIDLPVDIAFEADIPSPDLDTLRILSLEGNLCGLPFLFKGDVCFPGDSIYVNASLDIKNGNLGYISESYGTLFLNVLKQVQTDAVIDMHAEVDGFFSSKSVTLPDFKVTASIPESSIIFGGADTANFRFRCHADNFDRGRVNLTIDTVSVTAFGSTKISLSGGLKDLLGKDPSLSVDMSASSNLAPLSLRFGSDTTFRFSGKFEGMVNGDARLSQLRLPDIWEANLDASFKASGLRFRMPSDSIDFFSDTAKFVFGAKANEVIPELEKGHRVLSAGAALDTAFVRFKDNFEISLNDLKVRCHNDASHISGRKNGINKLPRYFADISASRLSLMDSDSSKITLRGTQNTMKLVRKEKNDSIPAFSLSSNNKFLILHSRGGRFAVSGLNFNFYAEKYVPGNRPRGATGAHRKHTPHIAQTDDDFSSSDINFSLGDSFKKLYREWVANGHASFRSARISTPMFPLKNSISKFGLSFSNNSLSLDSLSLKTGETKVDMSGKISGLRRALMAKGTAEADFRLNAEKMDINELIAALAVGSAAKTTTVISEETNPEISTDEICSTAEDLKSPLIVIPGNVKAKVDIAGKNISISKMNIDSLSTVIEMRDRCVKFSHISAGTNVGDMTFEGFYATRSKNDISIGFNLGLSKITAKEVISMVPHVDSIMPLLKSFDGKLQCYMAGTARLDTNMNILPPTIKGVIRFGGSDLSLGQTPEIKKVTRLLMFKNKSDFNIENMSVEAQLDESRIEVFPFLLKVDRYSIAASGIQNLNQSCRYHISVIKSPLPFRLGMDIYGDNFDKLHYKLVKPKYKSEEKIPVFSTTIDQTRLNLSKMISNIFSIGVDRARNDTTILDNIDKRKSDISYVAAQDSKSEAISDSEITRMQSEAEKHEEP